MMELRERLSLVKEKHKIEEEAKRNEILENKKKFEVRLQMAQEKVQIHRSQKVNFHKFYHFTVLIIFITRWRKRARVKFNQSESQQQ